jgi:hypothetical protein
MSSDPHKHATARERQREAIRRLSLARDNPAANTRPRGNAEIEPREVRKGMEKLSRVLGH